MMQHFLLQKVKYAVALTMAFLLFSAGVFAQAIAVQGKVTNDKAEPMPNASVLVKVPLPVLPRAMMAHLISVCLTPAPYWLSQL